MINQKEEIMPDYFPLSMRSLAACSVRSFCSSVTPRAIFCGRDSSLFLLSMPFAADCNFNISKCLLRSPSVMVPVLIPSASSSSWGTGASSGFYCPHEMLHVCIYRAKHIEGNLSFSFEAWHMFVIVQFFEETN